MRSFAWIIGCLAACGRVGFHDSSDHKADAEAGAVVGELAFYKVISIDREKNVGGVDLANLPIAIRVTDPDLRLANLGGKLETGSDLAFFDSDGATPLAFEIERLSLDTGDLLAWVKVPLLSATTETRLVLAFGDPDASGGFEDRAATWSDGYAGVWHLGGESYTGVADEVIDATGAHPGTATAGVTSQTAGKLARAAELAGNCANISMGASPALQPSSVTVSAWVMPRDIGVGGDRIATIVAQDYWRGAGDAQGYYLEVFRSVSRPEAAFYSANGQRGLLAYATGTSVANGTWHHIVGTYDAATETISVYLDGRLAGTATLSAPLEYLDNRVQIGCSSSGWWRGAIDEVRISGTAHSAARIATEYLNQSDPAAFVTVGPTVPATSLPLSSAR